MIPATPTPLIIFDFDGVIADSEVISLATLRNALRDFGVVLSADEVRDQFLGKSLTKIVSEVRGQQRDADWDGFADHWNERLFARFVTDLRPVPGTENLLDRLDARGVPYCIASSSSFARIGFALKAMELTARFVHVFSAEQVRHGKPAPDLFLHAAHQMEKPPRQCLVIEDSPYGIQAARAAGMTAIGFLGGAHLAETRAAHGRFLQGNGAHRLITALSALDGLIAA